MGAYELHGTHKLLLYHYSLHVHATAQCIVPGSGDLAVILVFSIIADTNGPWKY